MSVKETAEKTPAVPQVLRPVTLGLQRSAPGQLSWTGHYLR